MQRRRQRWLARATGLVALAAITVAPAPAARAQDGATVATAKATAIVVKVAPAVGALQLALGSGISVAEIKNSLAQAQSTSADLGLIATALVGEQCDGSEASFKESDLPHPIRIDNRGGDAHAETAAAPFGRDGAGVQQVRATAQPLAEAVSTSTKLELGPLVAIDGGRAVTTTEVIDGKARVAHGTVSADLVIPGILSLKGLQWDAFHRTGTSPSAHASFEVGRVVLLGQTIPVQGVSAEDLIATLNTGLAPLGITLTAPFVERFTDPADVVRITPLQVRFGDSPLGALLLGPLLDASRQVRDDLAASVISATCKASTLFLLGEIAIGQLSGIGSTLISVGGAEATTGLVALEDPFGDGGLLGPSPAAPAAPATPAAPAAPAAPTGPAVAPAAPQPPPVATQPAGSFRRLCESVHPFRWPSCSGGAGTFVGFGAIGATAGIALLDWRHQRRRSKRAAGVGGAA